MTDISHKLYLAICWWHTLAPTLQQKLINEEQMELDNTFDPPFPKDLDLMRVYRKRRNG